MGWDGHGVGWGGWGGWALDSSLQVCPRCHARATSFHAHHTSCNFHSDWILHALPTFTFSLVSAVALHLDNSISNAIPGLLLVHVHHTVWPKLSDWLLLDLPTFFSHFSFCSVSTKPVNTKPAQTAHPVCFWDFPRALLTLFNDF